MRWSTGSPLHATTWSRSAMFFTPIGHRFWDIAAMHHHGSAESGSYVDLCAGDWPPSTYNWVRLHERDDKRPHASSPITELNQPDTVRSGGVSCPWSNGVRTAFDLARAHGPLWHLHIGVSKPALQPRRPPPPSTAMGVTAAWPNVTGSRGITRTGPSQPEALIAARNVPTGANGDRKLHPVSELQPSLAGGHPEWVLAPSASRTTA